MNKIIPVVALICTLLSCSESNDYFTGSRVNEVTRSLHPVPAKPIAGMKAIEPNGNPDSLRILVVMNEIINWFDSDDFASQYSSSTALKNYTALDNKLTAILRANGFSSYPEFETYLSRYSSSGFLKVMDDSLKSVANNRINKIIKESTKKNN